ncbi:MAG TPA: ATP-binding protein [Acetobacteraceae bacterium]|jgi:C4-dicarboxylate-specific signal transduction histidine kinase
MRFRIGGSRLSSAVAFAVALLLVVVAAAVAQINLQRLRNSFGWVEHTQQVLLQIAAIDTDLASALAAQQACLLAGGSPTQLAAFRAYSADLRARMTALQQLTSDNSTQRMRLNTLRPMIASELDRLAYVIEPSASPRNTPAATGLDGTELQARIAIRAELRQLRNAELNLLSQRQQWAERDSTLSTALATATVVLALGAAALGMFVLQRERERSRQRELQVELLHVSRLNTVGQTASTLAHEVNQPLTAARNFLGAAQRMLGADTVQPARVADAVQRSLAQVDRASEIIRHLRRFVSRAEPGRTTEPVAAVIGEAILISALERGRAVIEQRIEGALPLASIDKVQIQQVLVNLMRNGLEAMAESKQRVLTISAHSAERRFIEISVADTGPGLPRAVADRLFQPFVTTKDAGMGVGLSICRTIVESHGGRIWANPNEAGGTVFHFTIPVADAAERDQAADD